MVDLRQHLIDVWTGIQQSVIYNAIEWHRRLHTWVNFPIRPIVEDVFVPLDVVTFQILAVHTAFQVIRVHQMPQSSSIGVEWSGNVTAAGSTRRYILSTYGLGSAVEVLRGINNDLKILGNV